MHISPKDFFYPDYPDYKHIYPPEGCEKTTLPEELSKEYAKYKTFEINDDRVLKRFRTLTVGTKDNEDVLKKIINNFLYKEFISNDEFIKNLSFKHLLENITSYSEKEINKECGFEKKNNSNYNFPDDEMGYDTGVVSRRIFIVSKKFNYDNVQEITLRPLLFVIGNSYFQHPLGCTYCGVGDGMDSHDTERKAVYDSYAYLAVMAFMKANNFSKSDIDAFKLKVSLE